MIGLSRITARRESTVMSAVPIALSSGTVTGTPMLLPTQFKNVEMVMSRASWPAGGVDLQIIWSDDGVNFNTLDPVHIPAWTDDGTGKHPLSDAVIGWGWEVKPAYVKYRIVSPGVFSSTVGVQTR